MAYAWVSRAVLLAVSALVAVTAVAAESRQYRARPWPRTLNQRSQFCDRSI